MWQNVSQFNFNRCLVLSFTNNTNSKYLAQKNIQRPKFKVFCSGHKHAWLMWKVSHKAYRHYELLQILFSCYKCESNLFWSHSTVWAKSILLKCEYLKDRACRSTNDVVLDILVNCFFQPDLWKPQTFLQRLYGRVPR